MKELFVCDGKVPKRKFRGNQHVKKYTFAQKFMSGVESVALYSVLTLAVVASVVMITKGTDSAKASSVVVDNLSGKVEELRWQVVSTIKDCERIDHTKDDGLITYDPSKTNKKVEPPSIGLFQYKITTVQYYYKKIYGKVITRTEAVIIALDDEKSTQLTYDIIFKSGAGTKDWVTCGNRKAVQDTLLTLKKLN